MKPRARVKRHLFPAEYQSVKLPYGSHAWTDDQWSEWEKSRAHDAERDAGIRVEPNDGSGGVRKMPVRYE